MRRPCPRRYRVRRNIPLLTAVAGFSAHPLGSALTTSSRTGTAYQSDGSHLNHTTGWRRSMARVSSSRALTPPMAVKAAAWGDAVAGSISRFSPYTQSWAVIGRPSDHRAAGFRP